LAAQLSWPFADLPPALSWALKVLGWGITAFAVSFGAPFWFEALSKLARSGRRRSVRTTSKPSALRRGLGGCSG
jgi:hypothetical protein